MFIGHLGVGFAGKRFAPNTSLQASLLAATFVDVLWSIFILAGVEQARIQPGATRMVPLVFVSYPWSHSLALTVVWAGLFGAAYLWCTGYRRGAAWTAAAVLSHWLLDFVSHAPDMALYPGGPRYGLSLYDSVPGELLVETAMFAGGLWLYIGSTRATGRVGTAGLAAFIAFVLALFASSVFAPPAPTMTAIALANLLFLPALLWAARIDRARPANPA